MDRSKPKKMISVSIIVTGTRTESLIKVDTLKIYLQKEGTIRFGDPYNTQKRYRRELTS